jgi:NADPH-dependent 2,4-dienoyl-CoA reductase/sulfur reductase-like enzyme
MTGRSTSSTTRLWTPWTLPSAPYALGGGVIGSTLDPGVRRGAAIAPRAPGRRLARLLRSLADADALRDAAENVSTAVVIGAGFIGCEAAASLAFAAYR